MKPGGDPRRHRRVAAALVALTLLPVALIVGTAHPADRGLATSTVPGGVPGLRALDTELPSAEAIRRGQASNLFAPFTWDGIVASGPFIRFGYLPSSSTVLDYLAVNGSRATSILESLQVSEFSAASDPALSGATFIITSPNATVVAHDEPMGLLEIRTIGAPHTVTLQLPVGTSSLRISYSTSWPASSVAYSNGDVDGRIILGRGNLTISGTTVVASLRSQDYLAIRALPAFVDHAAEHEAILDAFASGYLAAEIDLVAVSSGGWIENFAEYHATVGTVDRSAAFSRADLQLSMPNRGGGLVLLAFDRTTMPVDDAHRLAIRANGTEVAMTSDPVASVLTAPEPAGRAAYTVLAMNATVLAVYVPNLNGTTLEIQSLALPAPALSRSTQLAIVAAMFVVAVAAVIMFRRQAR